MSQNYLYFKNNLNYRSLLMGDKGLTSKRLFRLTPPTFWRLTPRSLSTISFTPKSFTMAFGIHIHPCLLLAVASSLEHKLQGPGPCPSDSKVQPVLLIVPGTQQTRARQMNLEYPSFGRPLLHEALTGSLSNSWGTLLNQLFALSTLHGFLLPLRLQGRLYTNLTHAKTKQNRKPEIPSCYHCICPFPFYSCHPFCHLVLKPICYSNCFCKAHQQLLNYKSNYMADTLFSADLLHPLAANLPFLLNLICSLQSPPLGRVS